MIERKVSILIGTKKDHPWSNKKIKLALFIRILFSPVLLILGLPLFLLWYLPATLYLGVFDFKTAGDSATSSDLKLDLELDSSSSDWSGRVLDIVRRVNR